MERKTRAIRIAIIVLASLLAVSVCALTGTIVKSTTYQPLAADATAPNNVISPNPTARQTPRTTAQNQVVPVASSANASQIPDNTTGLELYRRQMTAQDAFHVTNMFPGDSATRDYNVSVSHNGTITVHFTASARENNTLANGLYVKVELANNNTVLYNGTLANIPADLPVQTGSGSGTDSLIYTITVSLPTSAGNEYQNKTLVADFNWWVEESGGSGGHGGGSGTDTGTLAPKTGDFGLLPWAAAALISGTAVLVLRRKGGRQHG